MKTIVLVMALLLVGNLSLFATAQYPDVIIFEGKKYMLYTNPMEPYFEKHPDKKPKGGISSTGLRRGYVTTFVVRENELYLKDIEIEVPDEGGKYSYKLQSVLKDLVGDGEELKKMIESFLQDAVIDYTSKFLD
ncbi:MAG: hypothetical protein AAFV95_14715 [Bacteroidota bacterium]